MIFELQDVLTKDELQEIGSTLDSQNFVDGRTTARNAASMVKNNVQLAASNPVYSDLNRRLATILLQNPNFAWLVMPKRIGPFLFSQYRTGMTYGDHVDNSLMGMEAGNPLRADLSITVFLNEPSEYEGGELIMNSKISPRPVKLKAGSAIVYPTGDFHRVEPVTKGTRKVAITWIESIIRSQSHRQILMDVGTAMNGISAITPPEQLHNNQAFQTLSKVRWSLLRLWAET